MLEEPAPPAAERWIATFLEAYGTRCATIDDALHEVALLRAEATIIPALELERLRNRQVVFFLDAVSQYVDAQAELRDLPLAGDIPAIADEFGIAHDDALAAVRMALTGRKDGPAARTALPAAGPRADHDPHRRGQLAPACTAAVSSRSRTARAACRSRRFSRRNHRTPEPGS